MEYIITSLIIICLILIYVCKNGIEINNYKYMVLTKDDMKPINKASDLIIWISIIILYLLYIFK